MSKEYPYDLRYQTILGDVYLNNDKPEEAYAVYQRILKEEPWDMHRLCYQWLLIINAWVRTACIVSN